MPIYYEAKALERAIDTAPRITPSTKSVLKKIIRSAPVADVVEVTRCKDCKHYIGLAECEFVGHFSGGTDYFCADGERKIT